MARSAGSREPHPAADALRALPSVERLASGSATCRTRLRSAPRARRGARREAIEAGTAEGADGLIEERAARAELACARRCGAC